MSDYVKDTKVYKTWSHLWEQSRKAARLLNGFKKFLEFKA